LLILAGVLTRDKNSGTLDLVLTKPVNRWRLLLDRLVPAMVVYLFVCVVSVGYLRWAYEALPVTKAMVTAVTGGLFLGILGMTVANVTRNALAGYGVGMVYWFLEAGFNGRFTAPFYLFIVSHQVDNSAEVWLSPTIWLPVKIGMLFLTGWLFVFNGWLLDAGPTRRRAIGTLVISVLLLFVLGWWLSAWRPLI
jgi:ABC-type transport system involved in multi-copper enzyme maturation permease subunit